MNTMRKVDSRPLLRWLFSGSGPGQQKAAMRNSRSWELDASFFDQHGKEASQKGISFGPTLQVGSYF